MKNKPFLNESQKELYDIIIPSSETLLNKGLADYETENIHREESLKKTEENMLQLSDQKMKDVVAWQWTKIVREVEILDDDDEDPESLIDNESTW